MMHPFTREDARRRAVASATPSRRGAASSSSATDSRPSTPERTRSPPVAARSSPDVKSNIARARPKLTSASLEERTHTHDDAAENLKDASLPLDALMKRHFIVGQSGSGKTSDAVVMFEEYVLANQQVIAIDSTGVWWGLRSSLDGRTDGLDVFILGGEHRDMPLEPTAGALVAEFIVKTEHSFVLDLSLMRKAQASLFMLQFCERLYEAKATNKAPLHLMVDEADLYAPETPSEKGSGKLLLEAMDNLARRGRARGVGTTFITQRPQVINKSIIAQADVLHVFRLSHPLARKALDGWLRGNATGEEIATFTDEIASLEMGDCFIWSPQWRKLFRRIHVRQRETFDSSATPEVGMPAARPKVVTKVDIAGLKSQLLTTIEIAKAEDPAFLRARVAELEAQLAKAKPVVPAALLGAVSDAIRGARGLSDALVAALAGVEQAGARVAETNVVHIGAPHIIVNGDASPKAVAKALNRAVRAAVMSADHEDEVKLRAGERRILDVLARHYPEAMTRARLGPLVGIAGRGTTMTTYLGVLSRAKLVEKDGPIWSLTEKG
jgi:hypothetical protein